MFLLASEKVFADDVFTTINPLNTMSGNPISTGYFPNTNLSNCYYNAPQVNPYYNQYPYQNCYNHYYRQNPYGYSSNPYWYPYSASDVNTGVRTQIVRNIGQNLLYSMMNR